MFSAIAPETKHAPAELPVGEALPHTFLLRHWMDLLIIKIFYQKVMLFKLLGTEHRWCEDPIESALFIIIIIIIIIFILLLQT